jgi:hypothetical protein
LINDRRHRDVDMPLGRGGNLPVRSPWQAGVAAGWMEGRLPRHALAPTIDRLTGVGWVEQQGVDPDSPDGSVSG